MIFQIKLAGVSVGVEAMYDTTKDFCKEYLTEETPAFYVTVTPPDIEMIRERDSRTAFAEGRMPVRYSDNYFETLALAHLILEQLVDYGVLMFHGAVMAVEGKAYLFTAKSGTGKTTHCRLWLKNIPGCHILNGDKPLLLFRSGKVYACGSPWMGKEAYGVNEILPLQGLCILERAGQNCIETVTFWDALSMLLTQSHQPDKALCRPAVLRLIGTLNNVPLYRLGCNMQDEAALVSYSAMCE